MNSKRTPGRSPSAEELICANPLTDCVQSFKFFRLEEDIKAKHTTFDAIRKAWLQKEKPVVEGFLSWLKKRPDDSMSDEQFEQLTPWNEEVKAEIKRRVANLKK